MDELSVFPGVTRGMLNVRLRTRYDAAELKNKVTNLIKDGEIVVRYKKVPGRKQLVEVIFIKDDESMISAPGMQVHTDEYDD